MISLPHYMWSENIKYGHAPRVIAEEPKNVDFGSAVKETERFSPLFNC